MGGKDGSQPTKQARSKASLSTMNVAHGQRGSYSPQASQKPALHKCYCEVGDQENKLQPAKEERKWEKLEESRAVGTIYLGVYIDVCTFCRGSETCVTDGVKILAAYSCWGTTAVATPRETTAATLLPSTWGGQ